MIRIIFSDNGSLTDYSTALNNYHSSTTNLIVNHEQDALYVGNAYAFNGFYFKLSTFAESNLGLNCAYWIGTEFQNAIETIDETLGFTTSNYLSFQINRSKPSWKREDTQDGSGNEKVADLGDMAIYDNYWMKITFNSSGTIGLDYVGHKFINDNDLKVEYPSIVNSSLLSAIESGKTNYEEQEIRASRIVIEDLISGRVIKDQGQIIDRKKLELMTVSKTAELIYQMLGDDYVDQRREAASIYAKRLKSNALNVDLNNDGDLSLGERSFRQGYFYR